jgi:hypothetical protein
MKFDAGGNLIVAMRSMTSCRLGGREGRGAGDGVNGERMMFPNDIAIADGVVWFSDASRRFDQHHWMLASWKEGQPGDSLRSARRPVDVVLDRLMFANGVALGPGRVCTGERDAGCTDCAVLAAGPRAGQSDVFTSALPGVPTTDYNGLGVFWVALPGSRNSALEALAGWPWLRKVVQRMPAQLREQKLGRMAWVLAFNTDGQVVHDLQTPSGSYGPVTSVTETNGRLYFGSIGRRPSDGPTP